MGRESCTLNSDLGGRDLRTYKNAFTNAQLLDVSESGKFEKYSQECGNGRCLAFMIFTNMEGHAVVNHRLCVEGFCWLLIQLYWAITRASKRGMSTKGIDSYAFLFVAAGIANLFLLYVLNK